MTGAGSVPSLMLCPRCTEETAALERLTDIDRPLREVLPPTALAAFGSWASAKSAIRQSSINDVVFQVLALYATKYNSTMAEPFRTYPRVALDALGASSKLWGGGAPVPHARYVRVAKKMVWWVCRALLYSASPFDHAIGNADLATGATDLR